MSPLNNAARYGSPDPGLLRRGSASSFLPRGFLSFTKMRLCFNGLSKRIDFFMGEEGEVLQVFHHIRIRRVDPELVELVW